MNLEYLIVDLNLIEFSTLFAQQSLPVAVYPCLSVCVCERVIIWCNYSGRFFLICCRLSSLDFDSFIYVHYLIAVH